MKPRGSTSSHPVRQVLSFFRGRFASRVFGASMPSASASCRGSARTVTKPAVRHEPGSIDSSITTTSSSGGTALGAASASVCRATAVGAGVSRIVRVATVSKATTEAVFAPSSGSAEGSW